MSAQPAAFILPFVHYFKLGYNPCPTIGKSPEFMGKGWYTRQYTEAEYVAFSEKGHNVGLRCSNVVGLDIDVKEAKLAAKVEALCRKVLGLPKATPVRVGSAPKRLLVVRVNEPTKGFDITTGAGRDRDTLFQLLGSGKQFIIHGTHPETQQPYTLSAPLPKYESLKLVTVDDLAALRAALLDLFEREGIATGSTGAGKGKVTGKWSNPGPWTPHGMELAWKELEKHDPDMFGDVWSKVGFALHDGTHGADEGLEMWDAWSSKAVGTLTSGKPRYKPGQCAKRWAGFKPGGGTNCASLFQNDWPKLAAGSPHELAVVSAGESSEFFTTAGELLATPFAERRQFVEDTIQVGCTLLHGPGKKGKSWWLLDMADHIAHGKDAFINRRVHQAKVLLIGAEDMAHRFKARLSVMGIYGSNNLVLMHREQLKAWGEKFQPSLGDELVPWTPALAIETLQRQTGAEVIICDTQEVFELTLEIEHGDRSTSLTRQHYMSTSSYDEVAQRLNLAIILVAHWGAIKSLPMAVTNPHEMINTTKTKIAGALTSITLGPLANQELDDDSGQAQLSVMGKDISTGNRYEAIERDGKTQRHKYLGTARDVVLRDSLAELMVALEGLLKEKGPGSKVTSSELAAALGISRGDTVRKKIAVIEKNAQIQATRKGLGDGRVHWKQCVLNSSTAGYWLEAA